MSKMLRIALLVVAAAAFAFAAFVPRWSVVAIFIGGLFMFVVASASSEAGRLASSARSFRQRLIDVRVWGQTLPASSSSRFEVAAITAAGAGLLIQLRFGGKTTLLKVAQPREGHVKEDSIEIGDARYVSWGGTKLPRAAGVPAVVISAC